MEHEEQSQEPFISGIRLPGESLPKIHPDYATDGLTEPRKSWIYFGIGDALPCPVCGGRDLEAMANVVVCEDCDHHGPAQKGPEFACDWREAINEWNIAAGGTDWHGRSQEMLIEQGLVSAALTEPLKPIVREEEQPEANKGL